MAAGVVMIDRQRQAGQRVQECSNEEMVARVARAIALAPSGTLPLQQGLRHGSYALEDSVTASVLSVTDHARGIRAKLGIHYRSLIAGCQCADDPTPPDTLPEYCEVWCLLDPAGRILECVLAGE